MSGFLLINKKSSNIINSMSSYISLSYSKASYSFTAKTDTPITSGINVVSSSSEWSHNAGILTYTGPPRTFSIYGRVKQDSSTYPFWPSLILLKSNTLLVGIYANTNSGTATAFDVETFPLNPSINPDQATYIFNTNDQYYINVSQNDNYSGVSTNFYFQIGICPAYY